MSENELIGTVLIGIGIAFDLFGTLGLVRLPDVYNRLQAATKCVTLGTCFILVGAGVTGGGELLVKSLICVAFVLLTSPVGAHALARGAHRAGVKLWEKSVVDKYAEDAERIEPAPQGQKKATAAAEEQVP